MGSMLTRQQSIPASFLVKSPERKDPLIDSDWDTDAVQPILPSLGCSDMGVTVACVAWDPFLPVTPHMSNNSSFFWCDYLVSYFIICLHSVSYVIIIDSEKSYDEITLDWVSHFHFSGDLLKKQTNERPEGPTELITLN